MKKYILNILKFSFCIQFILISSALFSPNTAVAESRQTYFCNDGLGKIPIQQGGRVKPLYVHAREVLHYLIGSRSYQELSAVETYCVKSLEGMGLENDITLYAPVEHIDIRELIGLEDGERIAYPDLAQHRDILIAEWRAIDLNTPYKKALGGILNRIDLYQDIVNGRNWFLPEMTATEAHWVPLTSFLTEQKIIDARQHSDDPFNFVMLQANERYEQVVGTIHSLEYTYAKMRLPTVAMIITLIGLAALTVSKGFKIGLSFAVLSVIIQTVYITLRIIISGRAPITNMYETVIFSGYAALILSMIIGYYRREKLLVYVGMMYSMMTLLMINFAHGMLSPSIGPLVPVLRDNFWLSTHVTTIIIAYGAFALSWVLANIILFKRKFSTVDPAEESYVCDLIYTCLKYGNILLFAGIILGGVWADYSWGRFWGWDPKETWSLIVFTIYMAIIHGKYTSWIKNARFIPLVAGAFMSVMMAWFGVNYILATGLHSYGFSEGGAIFLGSFFAIQTIYLIFTWPRDNNKDGGNGGQNSKNIENAPA